MPTGRRHLDRLAGRKPLSDRKPRVPETQPAGGDRRRVWMMPAFWMLLLFAGIALIITLLTGCGRVADDADATPSSDPSIQTPLAEAEEETLEPVPMPLETMVPEEQEPVAPLVSWLVPRGVLLDGGTMYGYADTSGNWVIPATFSMVEAFHGTGLAVVVDDRERRAVIDLEGNHIIPWTHAYIALFDEGLIQVGLTDHDGVTTSTEVYDSAGTLLFAQPGYLESFSEGLVPSRVPGRTGYLDRTGTLVIPLTAERLDPFMGGYALVAEQYGDPPWYIDRNGNDATATLSSGLSVYWDQDLERYGYRKADGSLLTGARYQTAEPFRNGSAIVEYNPRPSEWGVQVGLLNTDGQWLIENSSGIRRMANGLFAVAHPLKEPTWLPWGYMDYVPLALHGPDGSAISGLIYESVQDAGQGLVSVCDGRTIQFFDGTGGLATGMPTISGTGSLRLAENLLVGTVNGLERVLDMEGRELAVLHGVLEIGDGVWLEGMPVRGGPYVDMTYPVLRGLADATLEARMNDALEARMGDRSQVTAEVDPDSGLVYVDSLSGGWLAWRVGSILVVEQHAYWYPVGAAHGYPSVETIHLNLQTGEEVLLKSLFTEDGWDDAMGFISEWITAEMLADPEDIGYFVESVTVDETHFFQLKPEGVTMYYMPYELASYAAGIQEFTIPWEALSPWIDRESAAVRALELP